MVSIGPHIFWPSPALQESGHEREPPQVGPVLLLRGRGVTYGLAAAVAWGISTIAAAQATRRVGTYAALLMSQLLGAAFLGLLAAAMGPSLTYLHGLTLAGLVAGGLLSLVGWLTYYRALEKGPVGVVGAVAATYGGVAAVLAVLVLGERLGPRGDAGVVLAVGGVCLAAAQSSGRRVAGAAARSGVFLAVVSAVTYGVGSFAIGGFSARTGWLTAALVAYGSSVAALMLALPFQVAGRRRAAAVDRSAEASALATPGRGPAALVLHHDRRPAPLAGNGSGPGGLDRATRVTARSADVPALATPGRGPAALVLHHDRRPAPLAGNGSGPGLRPGHTDPPNSPAASAPVNLGRNEGPISLWHRPGYLPGFVWSAVAGLAEGAALAAFSRGGQAGQVMVTSAVSSLYPVIPLAAGLLLFQERLRWRQVVGVFVIVAGLVMISLG
jgi:transporter family protein